MSRDNYGQATPPAQGRGARFVAIAAGSNHGLALRADGSLTGWGLNDDGQATPPAGNDFVAIAAGGNRLAVQSSLLRADGNGSSAIADLRASDLRGALNQGHSRNPRQGAKLEAIMSPEV